MSELPRVVVVGSCMTDLISYVPTLPKPGETLHGTNFLVGFGGKGANQAVAAAKLGTSTALVGKLGTDAFGDNYMANLQSVGINVSHVGRAEGPSGVATITVDSKAENCIVIVGGANNELSPANILEAKPMLDSARVAIFQMEIPLETNLAALKQLKASNPACITVFNAAPATKELPAELYPLVDIFCVNESEAEVLLGLESVKTISDAAQAAKLLKSRGCSVGMVTLGASGVVYVDESGDMTHVPCEKVDAVDTTGAGDAFIGALASLMARDTFMPFSEKVRLGCAVASESVTKLGTQSSYPGEDFLNHLLQQ